MAAFGPRLPSWATRHVVSYLGYTGRAADVFATAALDPCRANPHKGLHHTDWVHKINHDGYRIIVHRDGLSVPLYSRNAYDWTVRLAAIATAAEQIKAKSLTIDSEAVVLGPDGLSRFGALSGREAADTAILYAFDLIEHDGDDMHNRPFLDGKTALARLLRNTYSPVLQNNHLVDVQIKSKCDE